MNTVFLSAMFPFYGFITGNWKDFPWMMAANVAILAAVVFIALLATKTPNKLKLGGEVLARSFLTSLVADAAGLFFRFLPLLTEMLLRLLGFRTAANWLGKFVSDITWYQIWNNRAVGLTWTIASILVAGIVAFVFNYFVMLKKAVPEKKLRLTLSICLAVFSAPYSWTNPMW